MGLDSGLIKGPLDRTARFIHDDNPPNKQPPAAYITELNQIMHSIPDHISTGNALWGYVYNAFIRRAAATARVLVFVADVYPKVPTLKHAEQSRRAHARARGAAGGGVSSGITEFSDAAVPPSRDIRNSGELLFKGLLYIMQRIATCVNAMPGKIAYFTCPAHRNPAARRAAQKARAFAECAAGVLPRDSIDEIIACMPVRPYWFDSPFAGGHNVRITADGPDAPPDFQQGEGEVVAHLWKKHLRQSGLVPYPERIDISSRDWDNLAIALCQEPEWSAGVTVRIGSGVNMDCEALVHGMHAKYAPSAGVGACKTELVAHRKDPACLAVAFVAILAGSDYCPGIPRVGTETLKKAFFNHDLLGGLVPYFFHSDDHGVTALMAGIVAVIAKNLPSAKRDDIIDAVVRAIWQITYYATIDGAPPPFPMPTQYSV
jgi:hypothetical protein